MLRETLAGFVTGGRNKYFWDLGERSVITGSPEDCLKVLKDCEEAGIEEVILYFGFGGWGHADTMRSMDRVAKELSPHFN